MARIHVTRTIEYIGDPDWIKIVLEKSAIQLGSTFVTGKGIIYVSQESRHACEDDPEDEVEELPIPEVPYVEVN